MTPPVAPRHPTAKAPAYDRARCCMSPAQRATPMTQAVLASLPAFALLAALGASSAQAAFDLVPSRQPYVAPVSPAPATPVKPAPSSTPDAASAHQGSAAPDSPATVSPGLVSPPKPATASTVTATPLPPVGTGTAAAAPASGEEAFTIRGAARDLMLASVIRHMVPPAISITPMPPEIATRRVSYVGGGRPWREVLSETLARANLAWREEGGKITISAAVPAPAAAPPTPLAPVTPHDTAPVTTPSAMASASQSAPAATAIPASAPLSAPTRIAPPEPPPSPTPLASAAAPLSATPPTRADGSDEEPVRPLSTAAQRASANAPAPLPFGAPPPASGFEAATRAATWTVQPGDTVRSAIARWASSIGLPPPNDESGYSWTLRYGATIHNKTYFEALEVLTTGAEDRGIRADWRFSEATLVTKIIRKNMQ